MGRHSHRILSKHFAYVKNKLIAFAEHFNIAKHGDIKGYGREALTGEFLESHMPDQIEFLTGEIIDTEDNRSTQLDIILQSKSSPKIPMWGNIHLCYADMTIAAIEVKSNLTTQHLKKSLDACFALKALKRNTVYKAVGKKDLFAIPYIIFAFTGLLEKTILEHIDEYAREHNLHPDLFTPDMIVVLDKDYYFCKNDGWQFPIVPRGYFRTWTGVSDENLVGMYNYINNLILVHNEKFRYLNIPRYFEKSIGKKDKKSD